MAEKANPSPEHQRLIKGMLEHWKLNGIVPYASELAGHEQPEEMANHIPDAMGRRQGLIWIGEAKTAEDIGSEHSLEQYKVFGNRVMRNSGSQVPFYLAVPKGHRQAAIDALNQAGVLKPGTTFVLEI